MKGKSVAERMPIKVEIAAGTRDWHIQGRWRLFNIEDIFFGGTLWKAWSIFMIKQNIKHAEEEFFIIVKEMYWRKGSKEIVSILEVLIADIAGRYTIIIQGVHKVSLQFKAFNYKHNWTKIGKLNKYFNLLDNKLNGSKLNTLQYKIITVKNSIITIKLRGKRGFSWNISAFLTLETWEHELSRPTSNRIWLLIFRPGSLKKLQHIYLYG